MDLSDQLDHLAPGESDRLDSLGFDRRWFLTQTSRLTDPQRRNNTVSGSVELPLAETIIDLPSEGRLRSEWYEIGRNSLAAGEWALVVLAGGMATRMGGVVKALVEAVGGKSFLDLRLAAQEAVESETGAVVPLWLMTSHATEQATIQALGNLLDGYRIATFPQSVSVRLTPDGDLFRDDMGRLSEHAPGHGDLPEALQRSGLLDEFISRGGRYVMTANLDNLGATLQPAVLGAHMSHPAAVTCEVVDKAERDKGGVPLRVDGRLVVLEDFRVPDHFDTSRVPVFNTNTFMFDAAALRDLEMEWKFFVVEKEVNGEPVIQFERIINQVAEALDTLFLRVPRQGSGSRFLPVKDHEDLEQMSAALRSVTADRGMI